MTPRRKLVLVILGVLAGFSGLTVVLGLSSSDSTFNAHGSNLTSDGLAVLSAYPVYSLGTSFESQQLTALVHGQSMDREAPDYLDTSVPVDSVTALYGDCRAADDAGCAPPLQVQTW